jgi:hypothetical protein
MAFGTGAHRDNKLKDQPVCMIGLLWVSCVVLDLTICYCVQQSKSRCVESRRLCSRVVNLRNIGFFSLGEKNNECS